jgi:hypothetical protein
MTSLVTARTAAENGYVAAKGADRWERLFDQTVREGKFFYAVAFVVT